MRNVYILFLVCVLPFFFSACEKEEVPYPDAATGIYFPGSLSGTGGLRGAADTMIVTFAFSPQAILDTVIKIPVSIMGLTKPEDRTYKLTVDPASTGQVGVHYDLPGTLVIHANRTVDTCSVTLRRTPEMKTGPVYIILQLQENENFNVNMKNQVPFGTTRDVSFIKRKIVVSDMLTRPRRWQVYYHGPFSSKKLLLMNEIAGTPLDGFNDLTYLDYWWYWGAVMAKYFEDQKSVGNTIYEADGVTEMTMGVGLNG